MALNGSADSFSLHDIVVAIEGYDHFDSCVLGLSYVRRSESVPLTSLLGRIPFEHQTEISERSFEDSIGSD